jgi:hypothetical protein
MTSLPSSFFHTTLLGTTHARVGRYGTYHNIQTMTKRGEDNMTWGEKVANNKIGYHTDDLTLAV